MDAEIDTLDALLAPVFTLGAISSVGLGNVTLLSTTLSDQAIAMGATGLSYGAILSMLVLAIAAYSNNTWQTLSRDRGRSNSFRLEDLKPAESAALVGATALILGNALVPGVSGTLQSSDIMGIIALSVEAAAYYVVSYVS